MSDTASRYKYIITSVLYLLRSPCSSALGAIAPKAAAASTKRKETSSSSESRGEKKKKSALEEIMEVEEMD